MKRWIGALLVLGIALPLFARDAESIRRWREDLRYFETEAPRRHANLFHHLTRERFHAMVSDLSDRVPAAQDYEIIVGLARIVAAFGPRDGHSRLELLSPALHFHLLPLNFYTYSDGLFVRAAAKQYGDLAGARVIAIGGTPAADVLKAVSTVAGGDNPMSNRANTDRYLSISEVLRATGVAPGDPSQPVRIDVATSSGARSVEVTPAASLEKIEWVDMRPFDRALYLRGAARDPFRRPAAEKFFWYEYLPEPRVLYVNFAVVSDAPDESVRAFFDRVWAFADTHEVRKFVLDIRLNGGGNNYLNRPILYGLIRHEATLAREGTFFTIIGRATFSAAQNLASILDQHTHVIFAGEPTGGAPNHFGDALELVLPNSQLAIQLSSVWWQDIDPRDQRLWIAPSITAELSSTDARNGIDPVMAAVLAWVPPQPLGERVRQALPAGKAAAAAALAAWKSEPPNKYATGESELTDLAMSLFRSKQDAAAVTVFELNAESNPDSWRAQQNVGRAYASAGRKAEALAAFQRALALRPDAPETLAAIDRLR